MTNAKKRILIFSTAYSPFIGGAEIAVKEITDRMPDTEFVMVTARLDLALPAFEQVGAIAVHRIGGGNGRDKYRLALWGARFAETLGPFDTVWAIMASYAGFAALRYKRTHPNTKYVLTLQEGDSRFDIYKHVWWCWPYFRQIFRRADQIQAISSYLAAWAKRLGATCPIAVIPNGVASRQFGISAASPAVEQRIITVSRLVKKNGVDSLIRALGHLPETVTLMIVGGGEAEEKLKRLARGLGLERRIQFSGSRSRDFVAMALSQAAVFCRPSRSEGLGNAFLEAMAAGVPIVGTAVGGIPDFLTDGETGLVCRVDDPRDIAEKIQKILTDAWLAKKLADNGKRLVKERYEWDTIATSLKFLL